MNPCQKVREDGSEQNLRCTPLLNSDRLDSMRISAIGRLVSKAMQKAPSHGAVQPKALEALLERSWRVDRITRNNDDFKDCCGGGTSTANNATKESELLAKDFKFRSFKEAWRFMSQVADAAERLKVKRLQETACLPLLSLSHPAAPSRMVERKLQLWRASIHPADDSSLSRCTTSTATVANPSILSDGIARYRVSVSLTTHSADSTLTSLDIELAEACNAAEEAVIAARPPKKQSSSTADTSSSMSQPNSSAKAVKQENAGLRAVQHTL
jgi:pterin-4a-carbinolamine dehydratase